jgi:glycosyltransferase involved in cell wall biosynthesis
MNKAISLYQFIEQNNDIKDVPVLDIVEIADHIPVLNMAPELLFVTTFPPRECGIATYSVDLIQAIQHHFGETFRCSICALESDSEKHKYSTKPKYILNTDKRYSYVKNVFRINKNDQIQMVIIQHEFGLFSNTANDFMKFVRDITKPIIFCFHTILPQPNKALLEQVQTLSKKAIALIVMTENAARILIEEYKIPSSKINIIPHGTHLVLPVDRIQLKRTYGYKDRTILSTFGLLSSTKNIETTLRALPKVIKIHPDVTFLILGKTHPTVQKNEGEVYRNQLQKLVLELELQNNVQFVNEFLQLPQLLNYLQLTDIYLFTSKDPNQAVSGTFAYAISSGCPVISTPIPHAVEVIGHDKGLIFDFENAEELTKAILHLMKHKQLRENISLNSSQSMVSTSWQNTSISHALLFEKFLSKPFRLKYALPVLKLDHLKRMTTTVGMIQFAKNAMPDIHSGYTLDDNARALIVACEQYSKAKDMDSFMLIQTYFRFVKFCAQSDGTFLNYVDQYQHFTLQNERENIEDSTGRAVWALGYVCSLSNILPHQMIYDAEQILENTLNHLETIYSTRSMAFIIKGLYYQNNPAFKPLLYLLAMRLYDMYRQEKKSDWKWFEHQFSYGNSLLPEAMLCAYHSTQVEAFKIVALESFDFLLSKTFFNEKIKVIPNISWLYPEQIEDIPHGGEQPIDVAYTIMALEKFYQILPDEKYRNYAIHAFNWFLGDNFLHQMIYNPCTGGCHDGLEATNVNLNQGAESTLSYLMSRFAIERMILRKLDMIPQTAVQRKTSGNTRSFNPNNYINETSLLNT